MERNLELGLYLVVETKVPEMVTSTCNPFFVCLPMTSSGGSWIYDVTVYPKNLTGNPTLDKTLRESKDDTGKSLCQYSFLFFHRNCDGSNCYVTFCLCFESEGL